MLKQKALYLTTILSCAMLCGVGGAWAQDTPPKPQSEKSTEEKAKSRPPLEQYHLDFSINEIEDGKKINSRQYSMNVATNEPSEIKIGTRVPVATKDNEFQYMDVGTNIMARLGENRDQTELTVRAESSSFALEPSQGENHDLHPAVRQLHLGGTVLLPVSKPFVISSADDPNSRRQFQLEVTVTKIR